MKAKGPKCEDLVFDRSGPFSAECRRPAKWEMDGTPICGIHRRYWMRRGRKINPIQEAKDPRN